MKERCVILGAGVTGLAAGITTGYPVFEATDVAGGICASYTKAGYRFEIGGGHWIFGSGTEMTLPDGRVFYKKNSPQELIENVFGVPCRKYKRRASVYLGGQLIPYPLQANVDRLPQEIQDKIALDKKFAVEGLPARTMKEWASQFGETLCDLFFDPFNMLYTAGLYDQIAPQDAYKMPVAGSSGYNPTFIYPVGGLDKLVKKMVQSCAIHYGHEVVDIATTRKKVFFSNGRIVEYDKLISTLPLNVMMHLCGTALTNPDPHTSVTVLNIGAERGPNCPDDHWVYFPKSESGFHRVGFYSNVDQDFAPKDRVSIYVERAFRGDWSSEMYKYEVVEELYRLGFIAKPVTEVLDTSIVSVAYTWRWPDSHWREDAINLLRQFDIHQIGRYGRWHFQGIAESIKEGLACNNFV